MKKVYYIDVAHLSAKTCEQFWAFYQTRKAIHEFGSIVYEWNFTAKPSQFVYFKEKESAL